MNSINHNMNKAIAITASQQESNATPAHYACIDTAEVLNERGGFGDEIGNLLDIQGQSVVFNAPWLGAKPVLQLKYDMSRSESSESFNEFKQLATVGMASRSPQDVLYAEIEFCDPLRPDQPPLYMAATVHLGAISQTEDWCEKAHKPYDLLECATSLYWYRQTTGGNHKEGKFSFRGHQFIYQIDDDFTRSYDAGLSDCERTKIISIRFADGEPHNGVIIEGIV
ncbi:hypothetical protein [Undibacterium curvum]|uniref:Uncharacterized protein n=1 Tax=Undibacterium curvum TaxID=2762294 RepID=A0ABR7A440_9BURK|nr:hypothetical protein [Undibacterium curvum]MBC3931660.1 hypothetical protein [Undibacterium curvum]